MRPHFWFVVDTWRDRDDRASAVENGEVVALAETAFGSIARFVQNCFVVYVYEWSAEIGAGSGLVRRCCRSGAVSLRCMGIPPVRPPMSRISPVYPSGRMRITPCYNVGPTRAACE